MSASIKSSNTVAQTVEKPRHVLSKEACHDERPRSSSTDPSFSPPVMKSWQRRLVMFSLCLTLFLGALDITIVTTALPSIAKTLGTTTQQYAWIGGGYNLANTASMLIWSKASDIFGRKSTIMAAAATFMAGSLICALASSSNMLIGGRVIQGLGGGGSLVLVTIVIGDIFSLGDRAKYYGMTGAVWGVSSAIGPLLGGIFTQSIGWRWCFYINLPLDGIALLVLFFFLKIETRKSQFTEGIRDIDWIGFILVIGGTISFLYGLEIGSGGLSPWKSPKVICLILFGALILVLFVIWEAKFATSPTIPFRIFQKGTNIAAFVVACLHSFVFISFDFFLPLYFQIILDMKPLISGITLFALILPLSAMTMSGGYIIRRTGRYDILIILGSALMCLGNGLFILLDESRNWPKIIIFQILAGSGAGTMFQSPMIALQNHLRQRDTAAAMAAFNFLRSLFSSISIVIGTVLIQRTIGSGSIALKEENADSAQVVNKETYIQALHIMWSFYTAVAGVTFVSGFFIKKKPLAESTDSP
ncbi:unnamed protein product [Clonostachys chloroleuca]|uniref:Major facilitator superfamily (MFS) profile domain-containing protein n=1 Tax=Clonostachys chloroleuca TaxID=1926264 RepID=A0AA35MAI9_9HYPO|nr:unnamed protein product [Clonostachys chloroleuca]